MTALTAALGMHDRTAETSAFGRSPLPALALLSLALHAAVILLWSDATPVVSEPLPAGPIALQLENTAASGRQAQAEAAPQSALPSAAAAIPTERMDQARPRDTVSTPRPSQRTAAHDPTQTPPAITRSAAPVAADAAPSAPAPTSLATAATDTPNGDTLHTQLRSRLQDALIAHFDYPRVARRRGWQGVVHVGLRIEADGQLTRLRIIDSSGHALLDRAALNSLGRVGRLPDVMDWLRGQRFDMVLPVRYQLIDS